jgi:hypothetical protein
MIKERIAAGILVLRDEYAHTSLRKILAWVLLISLILFVFTRDVYSKDPAFVTTFF